MLYKWTFIALAASLISTTVIDILIFLTIDGVGIVAPDMLEFKIMIFVITMFINFTSIMTSFIIFEDKTMMNSLDYYKSLDFNKKIKEWLQQIKQINLILFQYKGTKYI